MFVLNRKSVLTAFCVPVGICFRNEDPQTYYNFNYKLPIFLKYCTVFIFPFLKVYNTAMIQFVLWLRQLPEGVMFVCGWCLLVHVLTLLALGPVFLLAPGHCS